jgi:hypothetical protein
MVTTDGDGEEPHVGCHGSYQPANETAVYILRCTQNATDMTRQARVAQPWTDRRVCGSVGGTKRRIRQEARRPVLGSDPGPRWGTGLSLTQATVQYHSAR